LAGEAREGRLEISPHAFSANDFIFFDYPRGLPYTENAFKDRWKRVKQMLASRSLPLSPVLNAHFHALSSVCLPVLAQEGVRFQYGELALDKTIREPDARFLPSGDPTATTGQFGDGLLYIYSGDSTLSCNQPVSLYDFLMHVKKPNALEEAAKRLLHRLRLTLNCGFASFVTTHEYLLQQFPESFHRALWVEVDARSQSLFAGPLQKVSMAALGRACLDHTSVVVDSVESVKDGLWKVQLSGQGAGQGALSIFHKGRCVTQPIAAFNKTWIMDIRL